jgi:hypothetical protein
MRQYRFTTNDIGEAIVDMLRVATTYKKRVKEKPFQVGNLVRKTILTIGSKTSNFEKWSTNWGELYRVRK